MAYMCPNNLQDRFLDRLDVDSTTSIDGLLALHGDAIRIQNVGSDNLTFNPSSLILPDGFSVFSSTFDLASGSVLLVPGASEEFVLQLNAAVQPASSPLRIVSPLSWPVTVGRGQTQQITVALEPPFDEIAREFDGVIELTVEREGRAQRLLDRRRG